MEHLKNNGIALVVHALLAVAFYFLAFPDIKFREISWIFLVFIFLAYIACGFFLLKPVKKSFLSVLSVIIAVIIASVCVIIYYETWESDMSDMLFVVNPPLSYGILINSIPMGRVANDVINVITIFLSPLFPSLLMYLGMVLRRCFNRLKGKKEKNCDVQAA